MLNAPQPPPDSLPSARALFRSTLIALAVAAVLLFTVVLPAEYGIDPTGIGRPLGLTRMGEIKVALALEAEADAAADAAALEAERAAAARFAEGAAGQASAVEPAPAGPQTTAPANVDMAEIVLQPDEGREFKMLMSEGAVVRYEWWTIGGGVNYDAHGDPLEAPAGFYHGYGRGQGTESDEGTLTAAFDGLHGWFWRNRTDEVVTVTLRVEGDFQELREIR